MGAQTNSASDDADVNGQEQVNQTDGSEGFLGAIRDSVQDAFEKVEDAVENIGEKIDELRDQIAEGVEDMMAPVLLGKLEIGVDRSLEMMGPKVGETAVSTAVENYPNIKTVDDSISSVPILERAKQAAIDAVWKFKGLIMDFAEDILELMSEGMEMIKAAIEGIRKVIVSMLKALQGGAQAAITAVMKLVPDCCEPCLNCLMDIPKLIKECYNDTVQHLEDFFKGVLKEHYVPEMLVDKCDFINNDPDEDLGEPRKQKKIREGLPTAKEQAAPVQQDMLC